MNTWIFTANTKDVVMARFLRFIDQWPGDKPCKIEASVYRPKRSDKQNAALFGVAYPPIMEHIGLRGQKDKDDLHEFFCGEYWGWTEYDFLGKRKHRPKRTTTRNEDGKRHVISTVEMMDLYAFVQQRAAEQGIYVPDPDPEWWKHRDAA